MTYRRSFIRAVAFDFGSTLIDPWPSVGHVSAQVATRHGCDHREPAQLNAWFSQDWRQRAPDFDYTRQAWRGLLRQTLVSVCERSERQRDEPCSARFGAQALPRSAESRICVACRTGRPGRRLPFPPLKRHQAQRLLPCS
jgi:hypothetical protein